MKTAAGAWTLLVVAILTTDSVRGFFNIDASELVLGMLNFGVVLEVFRGI
jgi:hypothetical protein